MSGPEEIRAFAHHLRDIVGNKPPQPGVFPDYSAAIVRNAADGVRELAMARWGMPSSQIALMESAKKRAAKLEAKGKPVDFNQLLRMEPDGHDQYPQHGLTTLAALAWRRKSLRDPVQFLQRE